ncbi:MAG: amidohydrolase family protein [Chloroflexota bacterium]
MKDRESADCIVCGEYVLTMNEALDVVRDGAVVVRGKTIEDVGEAESILSRYEASLVIEGQGRVVLPGLINTHTHAAMVYFRGLADDLPLREWLEEHIWPAENALLSPEFVGDAVELACLEMLRAGVTTYNDMYFFGDSAAAATKRMGMRAVLGVGILDFPSVGAATAGEYFDKARKFIGTWKGDELISPCIAPHAAYTCGPATLKSARALSEELDVPLHIHLSETEWEVKEIIARYGTRPVLHLEALGFLDEKVLAAHCVWVNGDEIETLVKRKVGVSHCIESNLKLSSGIAPVSQMIRSGVRVALGTDGAASNNDLNILGEMSTAAKIHKAMAHDPTVLDAKTVLTMATRWGAEVIGLGDRVGTLEKGKLADLVMIDLRKPHLTPLYNVYSHIVYSAMASDVATVIVNGRVVIDKGIHTSGREEDVLEKSAGWARKIRP